GFSNLGNTCYMNSALQCLVHIEELVIYFMSDLCQEEINYDNPIGMDGKVAEKFEALIHRLYTLERSKSVPSTFSPRLFKSTVGHYNHSFAGYGQQDSQELLAFVLDALHEDLNRVKKKPYVEKPESTDEMVANKALVAELAQEIWDIHRMRNDSVIQDLFAGLYESTLVCPECQKISITFDPFLSLSLALPVDKTWSRTNKNITLEDCLALFSNEEILGKDDLWYCPRCKEHRQASKKFDLWKLPDIFTIHLKRFSASRMFNDKIGDFVECPLDDLDMNKWLSSETQEGANTYELFAVDNHYGGLGGGHYTSNVKNFIDNKWYCFDDSSVTEIEDSRVVTSAAYVLFYRR
ncbi:hypothetical protein CANCADRAFT_17713, partial [Tortispora caseinolytica NRRL Y-17796]